MDIVVKIMGIAERLEKLPGGAAALKAYAAHGERMEKKLRDAQGRAVAIQRVIDMDVDGLDGLPVHVRRVR